MTGWSDAFNAQKYDEYARQFDTYHDTSRDLVDFAEVKPDQYQCSYQDTWRWEYIDGNIRLVNCAKSHTSD